MQNSIKIAFSAAVLTAVPPSPCPRAHARKATEIAVVRPAIIKSVGYLGHSPALDFRSSQSAMAPIG